MVNKTTNKLHFEDLSPIRFEDLAVNIVHNKLNWKKILHIGRLGNDEGVDIEAIEIDKNEKEVLWYVQCKRYQRFSIKDVTEVIDQIKKRDLKPDALLIVVSCSLSKKTMDYIAKISKDNGIKEWNVWTDSLLEAMLYSEYPDLLNIYFGISVNFKEKSKVELIEKRKKIRDDLKENLLKSFNPNLPLIGSHRFKHRKFMIRTVFDSEEETTKDEFGWYSCFTVQPHSIGDLGIEININWDRAYENIDRDYSKEKTEEFNKEIYIYERAHLPYENIYTYDLNSDRGRPIFYCKYDGKKGPFDTIEWRP
jgi:hypothetical protein